MAKITEKVGKVTDKKVNEDGSLTLTIKLSRENLKVWARVFDIPRWRATELCNPRKKKRGTMRRRRREKGKV